MKEYAKKPAPSSRTITRTPKAPETASIHDVLQQKRDGIVQREEMGKVMLKAQAVQCTVFDESSLKKCPTQMKIENVIQRVQYILDGSCLIEFHNQCPRFSLDDGMQWWHLSFGDGKNGDYSHITKDNYGDHYFIKSLSDRPIEGVKAWTKRKPDKTKKDKDHEYKDLPEDIKNFVTENIDILMAYTEDKMIEKAILKKFNPVQKV
jgi:hypothetical protein